MQPELIADYHCHTGENPLWHPLERCVRFPARKVSSATFGGDDLSDLYVTTALDGGVKADEGEGAGASDNFYLDCLE